MPAEVLKEYLISLGWDIKSEQLKKFGAAVGGTEAILKRFALSLGVAGLAIERNVMKTAEQLDKLYFAAQRVGTTAFHLQQFSYAAKQIGVSGDEMAGAISAVGMAMRMPGQAGLLRGLGVQSRDATTALDQLIGRLQQMPYFMGQNFAQQFGIGPQAYFQLSQHRADLHKYALEYAERTRKAGIKPGDDKAFNDFMNSVRKNTSEIGLIWQKIGGEVLPWMKQAVDYSEQLLERFSEINSTVATIGVTIAATFGVGGALALGAKVLRGIFGGGGGGAVGTAAGGASASAASKGGFLRWLMGSGAGGIAGAAGLGASLFIPDRALSDEAKHNRAAVFDWLKGYIRDTIGQPGASPGFTGHHERPVLSWFKQTLPGLRDAQTVSRRSGAPSNGVDLQDWIFGSVMRGGMPVGREASDSLRDWLRGSASFVPRVQIIQLPNSPAAGGDGSTSGGGIWDAIKRGAGAVGRFLSPISTGHAALPPDAAAHMAGIGLGPGGGGKSATAVPDISGMTAEERNFLGLVLKYESGGKNVMNYMGSRQGIDPTADRGYTAQGFYQTLNSTWRPIAEKLGIKARNAMAASFEDQTKVALALYRRGGGKDWLNYNPALAAAVRRGERVSSPALVQTKVPGERGLPPWIPRNSRGEPYSPELQSMSPEERANVERSMKALRDGMRHGGTWGKVDPETQRMIDDATRSKAPWNDDKAGALVPGGALGKQSNIKIEMHNDFQVSGFDHADVGREVVRGLGRQNADLVRNLRSAVG